MSATFTDSDIILSQAIERAEAVRDNALQRLADKVTYRYLLAQGKHPENYISSNDYGMFHRVDCPVLRAQRVIERYIDGDANIEQEPIHIFKDAVHLDKLREHITCPNCLALYEREDAEGVAK